MVEVEGTFLIDILCEKPPFLWHGIRNLGGSAIQSERYSPGNKKMTVTRRFDDLMIAQ